MHIVGDARAFAAEEQHVIRAEVEIRVGQGRFGRSQNDAAVGGGGLIQLPGLFTALPQQTPAALLGTNKFSSVFGTGASALRYARAVRFPWRPGPGRSPRA